MNHITPRPGIPTNLKRLPWGMPPAPLPKPQPSAMKAEDRPYEWIHSGEHVTSVVYSPKEFL
jgi:hypothetical protein